MLPALESSFESATAFHCDIEHRALADFTAGKFEPGGDPTSDVDSQCGFADIPAGVDLTQRAAFNQAFDQPLGFLKIVERRGDRFNDS